MKKMIENAEILCVGTELLIGEVVNTNASYISKKLCELGISVYHTAVVGDNPERLKRAFLSALDSADLVILSGGLGPTYDDLTKETVAECLGMKMVRDDEILAEIENYFASTGRKMTDNNKKQADIPSGAVALKNRYGTAPGIFIETDGGKAVVMLPGPPSELEPMMNETVFPLLKERSGSVLASRNIHIIGMGESEVESHLFELMKNSKNPSLAPYAKEGEVLLRITAMAQSESDALSMCDELAEEIKKSPVGKFIYGIDVGSTENALFEALRSRALTVSAAESCTGGLMAKRLTELSGVSSVFSGGAVTYSCGVKEKMLGVDKRTLDENGAVCAEVAMQMAKGARELFDTDIALSATGSAGPLPDPTSGEPVGTVYIGYSDKNGEDFIKLSLSNKRSRFYIRQVACSRAFAFALKKIAQMGDN